MASTFRRTLKTFCFKFSSFENAIFYTLDTNWDRLEHIANYDTLLRKILGVHVERLGIEETEFAYQTIVDNVSLIDEALLLHYLKSYSKEPDFEAFSDRHYNSFLH